MSDHEYNVSSMRLAVLIDGDNAQPNTLKAILGEVNHVGSATIRRIYGDWTLSNMNGWKEHLHTHSFQPIQQFRNTVGKNATDSMLIIDAMDILHTAPIGGFFIVSSDSDYTRLASRIREHGMLVYGVGEQKTPQAFVNACHRFIYVENIIGTPNNKRASYNEFMMLARKAFEQSLGDGDEWANLGQFGSQLRKLDPSFDPRTYGFAQLSKLLKSMPKEFELKQSGKGQTVISIRMK